MPLTHQQRQRLRAAVSDASRRRLTIEQREDARQLRQYGAEFEREACRLDQEMLDRALAAIDATASMGGPRT